MKLTASLISVHNMYLNIKRLSFIIISTLLLIATLGNLSAKELPEFSDLIDKAEPGVVNIRTSAKVAVRQFDSEDPTEMFRWFFGPDFRFPGPQPVPRERRPRRGSEDEQEIPRGVGSGFIISVDGYILTNHHVVDGADEIYVTLLDKRELKAKVIGSDARTDVALIKVEATGLTRLPIGDPNKLRKGEWVIAIGSPFGLDSTVTAGIVSAKGRDTGEYLPFIQTDVAVNPGNSGGPLLNMRGEVVGINSQILSRSGGFMGISFAIPIDEAIRVSDQLKASGRVTRGKIGVQIGEVTKDTADAIGLPKRAGALVRSVEEGSAADKAGIEPGDVIIKFGNQSIERFSDLPRAVGNSRPGTKSSLQVWRKGGVRELSVTIAETEPSKVGNSPDEKPSQPSNGFGLGVVDLPEAKRKDLRLKNGVLVDDVDGPAARAGVRTGDIILAVNNIDITNARQFNELLAKLDKTKSHGFLIRREALTQWVPIRPATK